MPTATRVIPAADFDPALLPSAATTRCWISAPIGFDSDARLPAVVARGVRPGPTVLLVAGVHGDEFEGVAALPQLVQELDPTDLAGTVIAIPVCNPFAFQAQSRTSPAQIDGANLAREFPGDPSGTPTQRLAANIFAMTTRLLGPEDLVVDLHSAGTRYRYLTLVGFRDIEGPTRDASEDAARHFGCYDDAQLWSIWPHRGMFNSETTFAGIPTVAAEAPGQGQCRREDVNRYTDGVKNLLRYKGILPGAAPRAHRGSARCPTEICAESDGLFVTDLDVGMHVDSGQTIGTIVDPFGETRAQVRAPHEGQLWAIRAFGTVYANEYIVWIA